MGTPAALSAPPQRVVQGWLQRLRSGDEVARLITLAFASVILLVTVGLVYQLWITSSLPRHKFGFGFLTVRCGTRLAVNLERCRLFTAP